VKIFWKSSMFYHASVVRRLLKKNAEDKGKYRTVFQRDSFSIQKIKIFGGEIEL